MGNHAEAATWSGRTGPWTYTGWHHHMTPSSPQSPFSSSPQPYLLGECARKQFLVL